MLTAAICLAVAAGLAAAGDARANCVEPAPALVWSYPADGATDVPTNARIFVLTSAWLHMPVQIMVNGVAVARGPLPHGYRPVLAPSTEYLVTFPSGGSRPVQLGFRFTTGAGPATEAAPTPAKVDRVTTAASHALSPACAAALQAMDCFDQGQDTHLVFETEARPLHWLIERGFAGSSEWSSPKVWPGACGPPLDFVDGRLPRCSDMRYRLTAVSPTGQTAVMEVACPASVTRASAAGGCSLAARGNATGGASFAALLAVALLSRSRSRSLARRRRPGR